MRELKEPRERFWVIAIERISVEGDASVIHAWEESTWDMAKARIQSCVQLQLAVIWGRGQRPHVDHDECWAPLPPKLHRAIAEAVEKVNREQAAGDAPTR